MDILNVYVIYDKTYTKSKIIEEIKAEGYSHNFVFYSDITSHEQKQSYLRKCSEVWNFGDCTRIEDYKIGLMMGKEFWKMG